MPKGVKRAVANAVTHGEGLSKSNQVITSAKMLSGTTPLKRVRVNGKQPYVRSRPVNGWCVDNGIQYLLGSRLLVEKSAGNLRFLDGRELLRVPGVHARRSHQPRHWHMRLVAPSGHLSREKLK